MSKNMCSKTKKTDKIIAHLLLLPSLFMVCTVVSAAPNYTFCQDSPFNYTPKSKFGTNLKQLLESLSTNIAFKQGFYNTSYGNSTNKVYAQALCRGDVTANVCQNCIKQVSEEIMIACPTENAIIWHELCQVQYSYRNFFSSMVYTGKYPDSNKQEKNIKDPVLFIKTLKDLMNKISNEAAFDSTKLMFSTGNTKFSGNETIYGLVQCTRDISPSECISCLDSAFGDIDACCDSNQGGTVFSRNCNMRFQLYRFYERSTYNGTKRSRGRRKIWIAVLVSCISAVVLTSLAVFFVIRFQGKRKTRTIDERSQNAVVYELNTSRDNAVAQEIELVSSQELPFMDFGTVKAATDSFSDLNVLGKGGFGTVYKGVLPQGKEIAVKRLSRRSWQGSEQFKNEVILIANLQHNNLVRLVGCGTEDEERLLVYEYMPNKSLDLFIFDPEKRAELHWDIRLNIIHGISRGLLYLHEDSRLRIIHRDLKPSNVLLDHEMVAKISDFGMARIFGENQSTGNTRRVVGTYGYMAPEYAMEGLFSVKSDVFSFGVVMLEIISGKRNSGFYLTEHHAPTLLDYAWRLWNEGKELEFLDPSLMGSCPIQEISRYIHIGLLCVQEDPEDRPTMSNVNVLLGSESMQLPEPNPPAKSVSRNIAAGLIFDVKDTSVNHITVSSIVAR